jgi:predicted DCC family thiol-disulfide oxidoreductase YuxK
LASKIFKLDKINKLILFDGVCNLCNGVVIFILKRDSEEKITFAPLQSSYGIHILETCNLQTQDPDTFVYYRDGVCLTKSTAALYVLKDLGWPWKFFYVFKIIPSKARNLIYDLIAKNRYKRFGRREHCMVPNPEYKKRFIEEN